ncbi:MAG: hypothetical protein WCB12_16260 [Bryobacteraceae bacterium]
MEACTNTEALREILYRYASLGHLELAGEVHDLFADICPVVPAATVADTGRREKFLAVLPWVRRGILVVHGAPLRFVHRLIAALQ